MFVLYAAGLIALVESYGLSPHLYADDTQIYGSCSPSHVDMFLSVDTDCVNAVVDWMKSNRLQLNSVKTEFMWCATVCRHHCLPTVGPLIGSSTVTPSSAVRDLGVYIDSGLTMQSHVRQTVSRCFTVLRQLRTVRRQVPTSVFQSFIVALVLSRLNYCNSVLFGLPANLIQRLQSVQNAALNFQNSTVRTHYSSAHQPPLSARSRTYLLQTGSSDISIHPRHLSVLPTVMFHPRFQHYIQMTVAVFYLTSSGRSAGSSLCSRQAGVSGFVCHRLERPTSPCRICAVTRGFQTTTRDLSVFPFIPRRYHMTRVLLSPFITTVWTLLVPVLINII